MVAKLKAIKAELQRRMHDRMAEVGAWLRKVVLGYYQYHAVPGNATQLRIFKLRVCRLWQSLLVRRRQRAKMCWERFTPESCGGCTRKKRRKGSGAEPHARGAQGACAEGCQGPLAKEETLAVVGRRQRMGAPSAEPPPKSLTVCQSQLALTSRLQSLTPFPGT